MNTIERDIIRMLFRGRVELNADQIVARVGGAFGHGEYEIRRAVNDLSEFHYLSESVDGSWGVLMYSLTPKGVGVLLGRVDTPMAPRTRKKARAFA